jgi:hypothetical protein
MERRPAVVEKHAIQWDSLPLFSDDSLIGAALLGRERASEWAAIAPLYERQGLPKIDAVMGGRYVPAVRAFFDHAYGLVGREPPKAPDGIERPDVWKRSGRPD